jgi:hypothetical protein
MAQITEIPEEVKDLYRDIVPEEKGPLGYLAQAIKDVVQGLGTPEGAVLNMTRKQLVDAVMNPGGIRRPAVPRPRYYRDRYGQGLYKPAELQAEYPGYVLEHPMAPGKTPPTVLELPPNVFDNEFYQNIKDTVQRIPSRAVDKIASVEIMNELTPEEISRWAALSGGGAHRSWDDTIELKAQGYYRHPKSVSGIASTLGHEAGHSIIQQLREAAGETNLGVNLHNAPPKLRYVGVDVGYPKSFPTREAYRKNPHEMAAESYGRFVSRPTVDLHENLHTGWPQGYKDSVYRDKVSRILNELIGGY